MKLIIRLHILLLLLLLAACGSKKQAVTTATTVPDQTTTTTTTTNTTEQEAICLTARVRMELSSGGRSTSLGGTLRMKRNDVIQLSLVTLGVIEVARLEMTPDYFMAVDKVGRQYVKASYADVSFLRQADVDFNTLQAYFWDDKATDLPGWERKDFISLAGRNFPTKHHITIPTASKTIKADLTLTNMKVDSEWEKRTQLSSRYTEVSVEGLLSRIMELTR